MYDLQARVLPHLVLDTIHCLWMAHDQLNWRLKGEARDAIMSLRSADSTDRNRTVASLRFIRRHLVEIEAYLEARDRPFTARKVRRVLDRLEHLTQGSFAAN